MKILIEGQGYPISELKGIFNDSRFYKPNNGIGTINSVGYYYSLEKRIIVYMLPKVFMSAKELANEGKTNKSDWNTINTIFDSKFVYQIRDEDKFISFGLRKEHNTERIPVDNSFLKNNELNVEDYKTSHPKFKNATFDLEDNKFICGEYLTLKDLFDIDQLETSIKHSDKFKWIRQISVSFYKSLVEFQNRNKRTEIISSQGSNVLNTNIGEDEYSYLDLVLSFVNFYKKNKNIILFHHIEKMSNKAQKPKWEKTIRKSVPLINIQGAPIYIEIRNKKKRVNLEEELLCYYFSILNHLNEENPSLLLKIDKSYNIITGSSFGNLQLNGLSRLRKIKYRYFSDTLRRMYKLCELYFDHTDTGNSNKKTEEFISVRQYNIVFEDMVDKLLTDEKEIKLFDSKSVKDVTIRDLKNNSDGKIIDHLFEHVGLIDTSNIFYIADSKYYKPGNKADKLSVYKQFTYAKNIIQFNIDFFNNSIKNGINKKEEDRKYLSEKIKYRDNITEGYNLTPNFLLYGFIDDYENFQCDKLSILNDNNDAIKVSSHWPFKLFDRDTLFVHQYKINFLFVLSAYTNDITKSLSSFREDTKTKFRKEFIDFFEDKKKSKFTICEKKFDDEIQLSNYVIQHFKLLNGKCFKPYNDDNKLLIAFHSDDKEFKKFLINENILKKNMEPIHKFVF